MPGGRISDNLSRAVIASEDAGFVDHHGVEWDAVEKAWNRNEKAEARVEAQQGRVATQARRRRQAARGRAPRSSAARPSPSSSPRTCSCPASATSLRKGQELVIACMLELCSASSASSRST